MQNAIAAPTQSGADPTKAMERTAQHIALAAIVGLTLVRIVLALFDRTELSTDEAQYWFWGQTFEFGAYSKPPLIGWILRVSTDLLGQSVAAVRLPAPLFHGGAALVLFYASLRLAPPQVALLAALSYLTLPAVALGSAVMTTDTPMLFAAALALLAQIALADARISGNRATGWAVPFGLGLGAGLLAKHAMLFWFAGAGLAACVSPRFRPRAGDALLAVGIMVAMIVPHVLWLARNDFVTLHHVQDITRGHALSATRPLAFVAEQFAVMGPVLFAALLIALTRVRRGAWSVGLAALALVPLAVVVGQGIKGPVLANWAALYLLPGAVLAAVWLHRHRRLAMISIGLGLAISLVLPVVKVFGPDLPGPKTASLLARYLGHSETALWALSAAQTAKAHTLIAQDRSLMADLSWFGAMTDTALTLRAAPPKGRPNHHWEAMAAFDHGSDPGPVVLIWPTDQPPPCAAATEVSRFTAPPGVYRGRPFTLWRLDQADCLATRVFPDE